MAFSNPSPSDADGYPVAPPQSQPPTSPPAGTYPPSAPAVPRPRTLRVPGSPPRLTYILLGINIVIFALDMLTGRQLTQMGAKVNLLIVRGQYWRLLTAVFLHADIIHIGLNGYFLYIIGPQVERTYGPIRFLAIYLLSGLAGSITSFAISPYPSIGASGALFGLIGAMLPLYVRNRNVLAGTTARIRQILLVIVINLAFGFAPGTNIDNWGHVGGLFGGLLLSWFTTPRYEVKHDPAGVPIAIEDQSSLALSWVFYVIAAVIMIGVVWLVTQNYLAHPETLAHP
jgi:rhomboid protease GluP